MLPYNPRRTLLIMPGLFLKDLTWMSENGVLAGYMLVHLVCLILCSVPGVNNPMSIYPEHVQFKSLSPARAPVTVNWRHERPVCAVLSLMVPELLGYADRRVNRSEQQMNTSSLSLWGGIHRGVPDTTLA